MQTPKFQGDKGGATGYADYASAYTPMKLGMLSNKQWCAKYFEKVFWNYKNKILLQIFWKYKIKYSDKSILKIQNEIVFSKYFSK